MGELVSYASNGGTSEGYLALPSSGSGRAVIVIQEWWGLVPHIKSVVDRFAEAGFVALAPDLFHGLHTAEPDEANRLMMGLAMDQAAKDIAGAAEYLAQRPEAEESKGKVGVVGFCMGGSLALWSGTFSPRITTAVGFYPAIPWEKMSPTWANYDGKVAMLHCSEEDGTSNAPGIQVAMNAIADAGGKCIVHDYPGTHHAFFNDDRPEVYDEAASKSAWARTLDVLRTTL
ncbi:MAG TPA: dienelactone hydrolase [Micromonosporaceae bacterium]|nr:dienelactone hydrolase [Micromonosporaceae bacterium]HCU48320.1 dienelactone hydrolase [Micromonosporaceae bacterium]